MTVAHLVLLCSALSGDPSLAHTTHGSELIREVIQISHEYDIPVPVTLSWMYQESRFDPKAVNASNSNGTVDRGVGMINSKYRDSFVEWFQRKKGRVLTQYEIDEMNGQLGAFLIAEYTKQYGSLAKGLARYNPGSKDYAPAILGKSTGRLFKSEVLPYFVVASYQKVSGKALTINEAYAIIRKVLG